MLLFSGFLQLLPRIKRLCSYLGMIQNIHVLILQHILFVQFPPHIEIINSIESMNKLCIYYRNTFVMLWLEVFEKDNTGRKK